MNRLKSRYDRERERERNERERYRERDRDFRDRERDGRDRDRDLRERENGGGSRSHRFSRERDFTYVRFMLFSVHRRSACAPVPFVLLCSAR